MKWGNGFLVETVWEVACKRRVVKMTEHLSLCGKLRTLCIEDRVAVDRVFYF